MEDDDLEPPAEGEKVIMRPPTLFLGGLAAGAIVELIWPLGPGLAQGSWKPVVIGLFFAICGIVLAYRCIRMMLDAGTSFRFDDPTNDMVMGGPYTLSRNPIYIGLVVTYFGLALALTSGWAMLLLPVCIMILQRGVILREEKFLERKFGKPYQAYKAKVPRWL